MIVALLYGGLFWGIFPIKPEISWESHLWGGISGLGLALLYRKHTPFNQMTQDEVEEPDDSYEDNVQESEANQSGDYN